MQKIIFSDIDGTILDKNYSFSRARKALEAVRKEDIPVIFCTSKTRKEMDFWVDELGIKDPFIIENGAAIFIPKDYFKFEFKYDKKADNYFVIQLGTNIKELRDILTGINKRLDAGITMFCDMSIKDISKITKLPEKQVALAKKREYTELFSIVRRLKEVIREIKRHKLNYTKGAVFHYIMGSNDKGKAIKILSGLIKKQLGKIETIGIGDSLNDLEMLNIVDRGFLVKRYDNSFEKIDGIERVGGIGPIGWKMMTEKVLNKRHR